MTDTAADQTAATADETAPASTPARGKAEKSGAANAVWMGTAVGIGSAALVAALMYAKRRK